MCQGRDKVPFGSQFSREKGSPLFIAPQHPMKSGVCLKLSRAINSMGMGKPCLTPKEGAPKSNLLIIYQIMAMKRGTVVGLCVQGERSCHGLMEMSGGAFQICSHEPIWDFYGPLGGLPCGTVSLVEWLSLFYFPL